MGRQPMIFILLMVAGWLLTSPALAESIPVYALDKAPTVDGKDDDWGGMPNITLALKPTTPASRISLREGFLKAGTYNNRLYLYAEWQDASADILHKPWVWSEKQQKYIRGTQREDRFAVQFGMRGPDNLYFLEIERGTACQCF